MKQSGYYASFFPLKIAKKIYRNILFFKEYFYYRIFYSTPRIINDFVQRKYLIGNDENLDSAAQAYHELFPGQAEKKIDEAEKICAHVFDLLGSGPQKLSSSIEGYSLIDWHMDIRSGYRWDPNTFYTNIEFGRRAGVDIKVPWELSRFQHLITLGQAYILTKNKKYAQEFRNQIEDWIDHNRVGFGVNWACTMDAAIRAANWLVAQEFFQDRDLLPEKFWSKFYASIYEHGKFIRSHLENRGLVRNNHYIADLAGLFFIAVYCPFYRESKKWQKFAFKELVREIKKQVYPDGCSFEASTSYHRLALELFFYAELLGKRAEINFPQDHKDIIKKMFVFSLYCIKPNGQIPQIGDNDSGRFLIFTRRPILEHKYLLQLAAVYYQDPQFKIPGVELDEEVFWIYGRASRGLYDKISHRREAIPSKGFENAGWFIIRDASDYCFVSCGPNGQNGNGGHSHNDKLSFELMIDGEDVIVDPGTYTYTAYPKIRNKFRSTAYHNTVVCSEYEQNKITSGSLFRLPQTVKIINADLSVNDKETIFRGEIQYADISQKRAIIYNRGKKQWKIQDSLSSSKPMAARSFFHLTPGLTYSGNIISRKMTNKRVASIETGDHELKNEIYEFSSEYGKMTEAICLFFDDIINEGPKMISTSIGR